MVIGQSLRLAGIGAVIACACGLGAEKFIASQLEFIHAFDALIFGAGILTAIASAIVAALSAVLRAIPYRCTQHVCACRRGLTLLYPHIMLIRIRLGTRVRAMRA